MSHTRKKSASPSGIELTNISHRVTQRVSNSKRSKSLLPPPPPSDEMVSLPPPPPSQTFVKGKLSPIKTAKKLTDIIRATTKNPTIVNPVSKFVVVTYWWGRGNQNGNTARPCISFFEEVMKSAIDVSIKNVNPVAMIPGIENVANKYAKQYIDMVYHFFKINRKDRNSSALVTYAIKKSKAEKKTSPQFVFRSQTDYKKMLRELFAKSIEMNKDQSRQIQLIIDEANRLKETYTSTKDVNKESILEQIKKLNNSKKQLNEAIKANLKTKKTHHLFGKTFQNSNIYDILNKEFRFLEPLTFEEMIEKWEMECANHGCNYLSVEYPEFTRPGGYQMAINAKPLFIKKALELCPGKNVLYIDGDMFIRKYPTIFDMDNVDFMARGWWIDPRSSYKMDESILYDPYRFETSGGTMFFSQSRESRILIDEWIRESALSRQAGKADDRILSLIFNTKKLLLSMNIIQLPIEYLWLTLDYDDRLMEQLYDYDEPKMRSTIFIEHPECLTSEETASGAGASNDRTPKYYDFLSADETFVPTSEEVHEYMMFPNKEMVAAFADYYEFMSNLQYINDGNPLLIKQGFVDPDHPENNEQPMYITPFDEKFGNKSSSKFGNKNENAEQNHAIVKAIHESNPLFTPTIYKHGTESCYEIGPSMKLVKRNVIPMILYMLERGTTVLYKPNGGVPSDIELLLSKPYRNLEMVFFPNMNEMEDNLKPSIFLDRPILFRALNEEGKRMLINVLSMFRTLEELSMYLTYGSYQIVSRIRMGYVFRKKLRSTIIGGSVRRSLKKHKSKDVVRQQTKEDFIKNYLSGLDMMNKRPTPI